jgi:hypothetical protein
MGWQRTGGGFVTDSLGFSKLDSQTIARLAQAVNQRLNDLTQSQTPESEIVNRQSQKAFMEGLDASGVPQRIVMGVAEVMRNEGYPLDKDAFALMVRVGIRFGTQLQRAIDAHTSAALPQPETGACI